jgi:gluconolactonase
MMTDWTFELVAGPYGDPIQGLAWDGEALLFSRPEVNLIQRFDPPQRTVSDFRRYTNHVSGLAFSPSGELYGCQQLSRRIVRFNSNGSATPMPYRFADGGYHNMPRYLTIDRQSRIWFSDPVHRLPAYGPPVAFPGHQSVLRLEPRADRSWALLRLTYDTAHPTGLGLSPDESTLYVAEDGEQGCELRAYPIRADATLGERTVLHAFGRHRGIDGMCVSSEGAILACAGSSESGPGALVYVFAPRGRPLATCALPAGTPTVCEFGDDGSSLYVGTSEGHLFRVANTGYLRRA